MAGSGREKPIVAASIVAVSFSVVAAGQYAELDEDGVIKDEEVLLPTMHGSRCCWSVSNGVDERGQPYPQGACDDDDDDGNDDNEGGLTTTTVVELDVGKQGDDDAKDKGKGDSMEDLEPDPIHEACCVDGDASCCCCWGASCD